MPANRENDRPTAPFPDRRGEHSLPAMPLSPLSGKPAPPELLIDVERLIADYYDRRPTSTTRGSASPSAPAATAGPPRTARSTRRTSWPSPRRSANTARARASPGRSSWARTRTPPRRRRSARRWRCWPPTASRRASRPTRRTRRRRRCRARSSRSTRAGNAGLADGIVITPSHNPPATAASSTTRPTAAPPTATSPTAIEERANELLADGAGRPAHPLRRARRTAPTTACTTSSRRTSMTSRRWSTSRRSRAPALKLGVDPMGGARVQYWAPIAERFGLDLTVVNPTVDPTLRVHDARPRRQDPHGLLEPLRDGQPASR